MKNSLNNKNLEWINCPKCGWHNAVLNKQTGLITCQYCMYRSDKKRKRAKMTTELEQEFYKTFEIEPIPIKSYGYWLIKGSIAENDNGEKVVYPEITDEILVKLICILNSVFPTLHNACGSDRETLLKYVLTTCIGHGSCVKHQIQQLFKGGE